MNKKIVVIFIMSLLIATSTAPVFGTRTGSNENQEMIIEVESIFTDHLELVINPENSDMLNLIDSYYEIYAGLHWRLTVTAYWDPPEPERPICLWVDSDTLPTGATFPECVCDYGSVSGVLDWTPTPSQAGTYEIVFYVGEVCYQPMGSHTVTVKVYPYEPDPINTYEIYEGQSWYLRVTAYWVPPQPERPICLWVDGNTLPEGATFTPECHCDYGQVTSDLYWTPAFCQAGAYAITFLAGETCGEYIFPFVIEVRVFSNFVYNLEFKQLNWFGPDGDLVVKDSIWGYVEFDYQPNFKDTYYFNLMASSNQGDGQPGWVIKNMPLFPSQKSTVRLGTFVNLEDLGLYSGTDLRKVDLALKASTTTLTSPPVSPSREYDVEDFDRRAWSDVGSPDMTGPFTNPGEPTGTENGGAEIEVPADRDINSVQEDNNKCLPGSIARSLDWLNREHELGIDKDIDDIYDEVKDEVDNPQGENVKEKATWQISKKNDYAKQISGNKIVTKVYDAINYVDPINGVDEKTPTDETLFDFLRREFETEDIEICYYYTGGSHIVTVVGVYETEDGKFKVRYRDDEVQGNPDAGDSAVKEAEIERLENGRYTFGSNSNNVWYVMSESVEENENEPPDEPAQPEGPETGRTGEIQSYETVTTDPDGDQVSYGWDWDGDNVVDEWTSYYSSGQPIVSNHIFTTKGNYEIKVKAKDTEDAESDWSEPLVVTMPKNKIKYQSNILFERFFQRFPFIVKILNQIL